MAQNVLTGDKEVMKVLKELSKPTARRRAMMTGLRESAKVAVKTVKAGIPSQYKGARRGVKWRALKVRESKEAAVKFGGVGKRKAGKKQRDADRPGVGLDAPNIHWAFLGTNDRRHKTTPFRFTGRMQALLDPVIVLVSPGVPTMVLKMREGAKKGVIKEVAKAKR